MTTPAMRPALDERGAAARTAQLDRPPSRLVYLRDVVPVDDARLDAERVGASRDALARCDRIGGGEFRIAVVLADEQDRGLPERSQVQRLEENALIRCAVAEKRDCDRVTTELSGGECEPDGVRDSPAHDPVGADGALGRRAHVHGTALAAAEAARTPENLGEHALRVEASSEHVVMPAMGRGDLVSGTES